MNTSQQTYPRTEIKKIYTCIVGGREQREKETDKLEDVSIKKGQTESQITGCILKVPLNFFLSDSEEEKKKVSSRSRNNSPRSQGALLDPSPKPST